MLQTLLIQRQQRQTILDAKSRKPQTIKQDEDPDATTGTAEVAPIQPTPAPARGTRRGRLQVQDQLGCSPP